jgi:hypothetical protein
LSGSLKKKECYCRGVTGTRRGKGNCEGGADMERWCTVRAALTLGSVTYITEMQEISEMKCREQSGSRWFDVRETKLTGENPAGKIKEYLFCR